MILVYNSGIRCYKNRKSNQSFDRNQLALLYLQYAQTVEGASSGSNF